MVKNKNPRKGTETVLREPRFLKLEWLLKTKIPVRGRKPCRSPLLITIYLIKVKNKNPRKGTETPAGTPPLRLCQRLLKTKIPVRGRKRTYILTDISYF